MSMFSRLRSHLLRIAKQEDGAVTVDWVVLTGVVITLCLLLITLMNDAYTAGGQALEQSMAADP